MVALSLLKQGTAQGLSVQRRWDGGLKISSAVGAVAGASDTLPWPAALYSKQDRVEHCYVQLYGLIGLVGS